MVGQWSQIVLGRCQRLLRPVLHRTPQGLCSLWPKQANQLGKGLSFQLLLANACAVAGRGPDKAKQGRRLACAIGGVVDLRHRATVAHAVARQTGLTPKCLGIGRDKFGLPRHPGGCGAHVLDQTLWPCGLQCHVLRQQAWRHGDDHLRGQLRPLTARVLQCQLHGMRAQLHAPYLGLQFDMDAVIQLRTDGLDQALRAACDAVGRRRLLPTALVLVNFAVLAFHHCGTSAVLRECVHAELFEQFFDARVHAGPKPRRAQIHTMARSIRGLAEHATADAVSRLDQQNAMARLL